MFKIEPISRELMSSHNICIQYIYKKVYIYLINFFIKRKIFYRKH